MVLLFFQKPFSSGKMVTKRQVCVGTMLIKVSMREDSSDVLLNASFSVDQSPQTCRHQLSNLSGGLLWSYTLWTTKVTL